MCLSYFAISFFNSLISMIFDVLPFGADELLSCPLFAHSFKYSSIPPGRSRSFASPSSPTKRSQTRSRKYLSCEITKSVPPKESNKSSSAVKVSTSKSFVGSSRSKTLGLSISNLVNCNLRRSPPDKSPTGVHCESVLKPNRSHNWLAESSLPFPSCTWFATFSTASKTRQVGSNSSKCCDKKADLTVTPVVIFPALAAI